MGTLGTGDTGPAQGGDRTGDTGKQGHKVCVQVMGGHQGQEADEQGQGWGRQCTVSSWSPALAAATSGATSTSCGLGPSPRVPGGWQRRPSSLCSQSGWLCSSCSTTSRLSRTWGSTGDAERGATTARTARLQGQEWGWHSHKARAQAGTAQTGGRGTDGDGTAPGQGRRAAAWPAVGQRAGSGTGRGAPGGRRAGSGGAAGSPGRREGAMDEPPTRAAPAAATGLPTPLGPRPSPSLSSSPSTRPSPSPCTAPAPALPQPSSSPSPGPSPSRSRRSCRRGWKRRRG